MPIKIVIEGNESERDVNFAKEEIKHKMQQFGWRATSETEATAVDGSVGTYRAEIVVTANP